MRFASICPLRVKMIQLDGHTTIHQHLLHTHAHTKLYTQHSQTNIKQTHLFFFSLRINFISTIVVLAHLQLLKNSKANLSPKY